MYIKAKDYNCSFQETLSNFLAQARLSVDGHMLALVNLQNRYEVRAKSTARNKDCWALGLCALGLRVGSRQGQSQEMELDKTEGRSYKIPPNAIGIVFGNDWSSQHSNMRVTRFATPLLEFEASAEKEHGVIRSPFFYRYHN